MSLIRRIFRQVSIRANKTISTKPVFLNVLMTDIRRTSVQQKLMSFYTIIDRCLKDGRRVNVVVALGTKNIAEGRAIYTECLSDYLQVEGFNLICVTPKPWLSGRLLAIFYVVVYFTRLRDVFTVRLNFACLSALARVRINTFYDIYEALPCRNWLGLTGGVELPAFKYKCDQLVSGACVSALQFGQASLEQQHFVGYKVDIFFTYDDLSADVFKQLHMQVADLVISGSPEFEYHASRLCNQKLAEEEKLNVVFIDQPVLQRGEYSVDFLQVFYAMLLVLNDDPEVSLKVKLHPRGSAFDAAQMAGFSAVEDWSDCLSRTHVVIGFFSNLCDFALCCGRLTFYVGSETLLDKSKSEWITNRGGCVTDDIDFVGREIMRLKSQYTDLANKIISAPQLSSDLPSEIIYNKMVSCSEAKAVA